MLLTGVAVQVQNAFDGRWVGGFDAIDVVEHDGIECYVLRRRSDGATIPTPLPADRIRPFDVVSDGRLS